jgi:hypothetical protein
VLRTPIRRRNRARRSGAQSDGPAGMVKTAMAAGSKSAGSGPRRDLRLISAKR